MFALLINKENMYNIYCISELKESLTRVGADIKQKIMESLKSTWNSINEFAKAHKNSSLSLEEQVDSQMSSVMQDFDDDKSDTACK